MNEENKDLAIRSTELSVEDVVKQAGKIQQLMTGLMKNDEHYGIIPGTKKPTLYKAGAEKLCFTFRLIPSYDIKQIDMPNGHREYIITCTLTHQGSGAFMGQGVGSASTMESKYRYRGNGFEVTEDPIPKDARDRKAEYRKQGFGMKKIDNEWVWVQYTDDKQENPDIADCYNTILKMAKKRAHVDATITACAASDIFTQDLEDLQDKEAVYETKEVKKEIKIENGQLTDKTAENVAAEIVELAQKEKAAIDEQQFNFCLHVRDEAVKISTEKGTPVQVVLNSALAKLKQAIDMKDVSDVFDSANVQKVEEIETF